MTAEQKQSVRDSFALVVSIKDDAAALFYGRLFELDPSLRPMFKGEMTKQGQMLMSMIGAAVNGLRNLEKLAPVVRQLGARHAGYGVRASHYRSVGDALITAVRERLGDAATPDVVLAWRAAYDLIAETMLQGAAASEARMPRPRQ